MPGAIKEKEGQYKERKCDAVVKTKDAKKRKKRRAHMRRALSQNHQFSVCSPNPFSPASTSFRPVRSYVPDSPPTYCPSSPSYSPSSPTYVPTSPEYYPSSPSYSPSSPSYSPSSPTYVPTSPEYSPASPSYTPTSPTYSPDSPTNSPDSPTNSPDSPANSPDSAANSSDSPTYSPNRPTNSPDGPIYGFSSSSYSTSSPTYLSSSSHSSNSPTYSPSTASHSTSSPSYSPQRSWYSPNRSSLSPTCLEAGYSLQTTSDEEEVDYPDENDDDEDDDNDYEDNDDGQYTDEDEDEYSDKENDINDIHFSARATMVIVDPNQHISTYCGKLEVQDDEFTGGYYIYMIDDHDYELGTHSICKSDHVQVFQAAGYVQWSKLFRIHFSSKATLLEFVDRFNEGVTIAREMDDDEVTGTDSTLSLESSSSS